MSKRQFVSTILWLIVVNLVIKAFFIIGIDLQVQQRTGPSEYGLYFTLLNLCYIFQIINDFGLNLLHNTDTAVHGKIRVERYFQILRLKIILALFYSLAIAVTAIALGYADYWKLLIWLVVNNILVSLILVFRAGISGIGRYKAEAMISVMDKALMILICGFLLLSFTNFRIEWFIWAQTASLVITAIVALLMSVKHIDRTETNMALAPMEVVFKDTLPFTIASLLMFIYTRSDSIMIEKLMPEGTYHVGVYAAGYRLLDAANMIAYLFSPLLIPMYARLMQNRTETLQLLRLSSGMMICMTAMISLAGFWWGEPIMRTLYRDLDHQWIITFRILILSHIPIGLMYVYGSYLTAISQMRPQIILFIVSVLISIGLNFLLIPQFNTVGAAIAAVITQSFTTIGLILLCSKQIQQPVEWKRLRAIAVYFLFLTAVGWLMQSIQLNWMIEIPIFFAMAILLGFALRLLKLDSFLDLLKRREINTIP